MANKIEQLIQDPDLGSLLSKNSREHAEKFAWKNVKNEWLSVINNHQSLNK